MILPNCSAWLVTRDRCAEIFTSADASGTRDIDGFWISACLNFGLKFSHFWKIFVTQMSRLAKDDVTRKITNFGAVKEARDP